MRAWLSSVVTARFPELAVVVGLGYALANLADAAAEIGVNVLAQHVGRDPFSEDRGGQVTGLLDLFSSPYYLNFSIGDTVIVYGAVLSALLAVGFVTLGVFAAARYRDRQLGLCPFCAARIPYESTHCAFCGSGVDPGEP